MPKRDLFNMAQDSRGNFKRTLGVKVDSDGQFKPHTFYLGRERGPAAMQSHKLGLCWDAVHERWYRRRDTPRAVWDDTTLEIAKAVGLGKAEVAVSYPFAIRADVAFALEFRAWLAELRLLFPMIKVVPAQTELAALVDEVITHEREYHEKMGAAHSGRAEALDLLQTGALAKGAALAEALTAYGEHLKTRYAGADGKLTEFGGNVLRRLANMTEHLRDRVNTPLTAVGNKFLDDWLAYWSARPRNKRNKPCSRDWCKSVIKQIRDFVRWLNRSDYGWRKPHEYEVLPVRVKTTHDELAADEEPARYRRSELAVLWEYAVPRDRVFMLLGLNCGYGLREIATLRVSQIKFKDGKGVIRRRRTKTGVWGRWVLWPETVAALRWYMDRVRPRSDSPYLILTDRGQPLMSRTEGGNPKQTIPNAWLKLYVRIRKDKETFPKLSFNKLRKTGATFMRRHYGAEVADLYLAHGSRQMVDAYSPKAFRRLNPALRQFRSYLGRALASVAVPFPETGISPKTSTSRDTIRQIQKLRQAGRTLKQVAAEVWVSIVTVRRYEHAAL